MAGKGAERRIHDRAFSDGAFRSGRPFGGRHAGRYKSLISAITAAPCMIMAMVTNILKSFVLMLEF